MKDKQLIYLKVELDFEGMPPFRYLWNSQHPIEITNEANTPEEKYIFEMTQIEASQRVNYRTTGIFKKVVTDNRFIVFKDYSGSSEPICIQNAHSLVKAFLVQEKNYENLITTTRNIFKKFRWRFQLHLYKNTETKFSFFYSVDKKSWNSIVDCPAITDLRITVSSTPDDEKLIHTVAKEFFEEHIEEPIYVDMMREANLIKHPNYKSAFAIAVAALETAIKEFISRKIDRTRTLVYNMPSPDLYKIFNKVLPELETRIKLNEDCEKEIKTIVSKRNELMHKGELDSAKITKYITTIQDLILLLDYFSGFDWLDIQHARQLLENPNF